MLDLRVHFRVTALPAALEQAQGLVALIDGLAELRRCEVEPYWKFPDSWEVRLLLRAGDERQAFDRLRAALAETWELHDGDPQTPWAVWEPSCHGAAHLPAARWAHLEIQPPDEP